MNTEFKKQNLSEITLEVFKEALQACLDAGLTNHAPLGSSGEHLQLYSRYNPSKSPIGVSRDRELSIRLHNGTLELLLTDRYGRFMFYGKYSKILGIEFIAKEFYRVFKELERFLIPDSVD